MSRSRGSQYNIRLPPKWIELNITKRECATFLAGPGDGTVCQCGRRKIDHGDFAKVQHRPDTWSPTVHAKVFNTDAYGTILFEGEHHPNKAHYVRLSYDTNPELIVQLMTYVWNLEMPQLVISVRGGSTNFEFPPRLGKIFQTGLMKAAKSTNAWIFTNGLNSGVARHVGAAINNERWSGGLSKKCKVVSVGIAPWGMVEGRSVLIGKNKDRVYSPLDVKSKFLHLNPRHSNFLMVDNGSIGKFGGENYLRRRLENCIASYPCSQSGGCETPVVVIVIEGGFYTLRQISDYVHGEPPVPVVIFAGTGRTADLVAWMIRKVHSEEDFEKMKDAMYRKMMQLYKVDVNQCPVLLDELKTIYQRKNLITVYSPNSANVEGDFDAVILSSIFRCQHWTPLQQLTLTLVWDRVDIAHTEVFIYGREWSREHLEHAMMEALVSNRLNFVNLLLDHGLNMQTFLTATRLESLYSLDRIPSKLMRSLLIEFSNLHKSKHIRHIDPNKERDLTLYDIGVALSHMMGHIYKSHYIHFFAKINLSGDAVDDYDSRNTTFLHPFDDLFLWAVLTKRHDMSKLLWPHGHGALAKALIATKLNKFLANEIKTTDTTLMNVAADFESYAEDWENLSLALLDSCYRADSKIARQLLTMELENWSKQTCMSLAVLANHRQVIGHPCCQILLADLWMGALNIKANATLKIALGILFPPFAFFWEYKSTEELMLLPHEERNEPRNDVDDRNWGCEMNEQYVLEGGDLGFPLNEDSGGFQNGYHNPSNTTTNTKSKQSMLSPQKKHHYARKTDLAHVTSIVRAVAAGRNDDECIKIKPQQRGDNDNVVVVESENAKSKKKKVVIMGNRQGEQHPHHHHVVACKRSEIATDVTHEAFRFQVERTLEQEHTDPSSFVTTQQSLKIWSRFVEFQKAPVTNFYRHTMGYFLFLVAFAFIILYPQDPQRPNWVEWYVMACFVTHFLECLREFMQIEAMSFAQKLLETKRNIWLLFDLIILSVCLSCGMVLRFTPGYFEHGMLVYRMSSIYWNLRMYKYLGVHQFVGPKIVMMRRMLRHMVHFSMIIVVVIISFGIAREAIRFPNVYPSYNELMRAFLEPYVMMFGEVELDALSPECGELNDSDTGPKKCPSGYWVVPIVWIFYMLVSNILIVNVLIAVFNGIYEEVDSIAMEIWMFRRFNFVMEFEQKPLLPPPLIAISHVLSLLKCFHRRFMSCLCEQELLESALDEDEHPHVIMGNDRSLKSFLSKTEQSMVFDFEECNLDANITPVLFKETSINPTSTVGSPDAATAFRLGLGSEKLNIQQMKVVLSELHQELESQKGKLDKLLNYWEMDTCPGNDYDDVDNDEETVKKGVEKGDNLAHDNQEQMDGDDDDEDEDDEDDDDANCDSGKCSATLDSTTIK